MSDDRVLRVAFLSMLVGLVCAIGLLLVVQHARADGCQPWAASSIQASRAADGTIVVSGPHRTSGCRP